MKKVIGITSIVLFILVAFQSCAAGVGNVLSNNKEASGSAGIMLAILMLIAGIIAIISKYSKGMTITSIVFYVLAFIVGIANVGHFKDLQIWSILNLIFAALLVFHIFKNKQLYNGNKDNSNNTKE
jgi:Ca2+/Na+ antiporter